MKMHINYPVYVLVMILIASAYSVVFFQKDYVDIDVVNFDVQCRVDKKSKLLVSTDQSVTIRTLSKIDARLCMQLRDLNKPSRMVAKYEKGSLFFKELRISEVTVVGKNDIFIFNVISYFFCAVVVFVFFLWFELFKRKNKQ